MFYVKPRRTKTARFCSKACQGKWQSMARRGEINPAWRGGLVSYSCEHCGREFFAGRSAARKFCSAACYHESRIVWKECVCEECGKTFLVKPSASNPCRFCSQECHYKSMIERVTVTCQECGREFETVLSNLQRGSAKYCSRSCKDKAHSRLFSGENHPLWKGGPVERSCQWCGKKFFTPLCNVLRGNGKYCSPACQYESMEGSGCNLWQGGKSFKPYTEDFNERFKSQIRERDRYCCAICGKRGKSIHHIDYDKTNSCISNCITLCRSCHAKTNQNRSYWQTFLSKALAEREIAVA